MFVINEAAERKPSEKARYLPPFIMVNDDKQVQHVFFLFGNEQRNGGHISHGAFKFGPGGSHAIRVRQRIAAMYTCMSLSSFGLHLD